MLQESEVTAVKQNIVNFMVQLPPNLQAQIGEAISLIADSDFPDKWDYLITDLTSKLSDNIPVNNGVLTVAHSIFSRWRPLFRSDALFTEIAGVLKVFSQPFLDILKHTDSVIQQNSGNKQVLKELFVTMNLLVNIYFDLNCQDIPEFFEDHSTEGFEIIHRYLVYTNPLLESEDEDESGPMETLKSSICELLQLYTQRYEEVFEPFISQFVDSILQLLVSFDSNKKYDILTYRSLAFLTTVARTQTHSERFIGDDTLLTLIKDIVLPNTALQQSDEELFEDDPIEFIRRDLEGSDNDTRRRGCMDFLKQLALKNEAKVTSVVMKFVTEFLNTYNSNKEAWRQKDTAIFLFSAIATKGNVTSAGVANTNILVDVNGFFTENLAAELVSETANPILKIDAIKYIHTFRNQLSRDILIQAFPLLANHMQSQIYVVYTYAAITIEKVITLKDPTTKAPVFDKNDIDSITQTLLQNLFGIIQRANSPEKLAENEFLMRCVMRVLITAQDSVAPYAMEVLKQLVLIVGVISKNPSNPKFSHYTFESIATLIRYGQSSLGINTFEETLFPDLLGILHNDVSEFVPYVFQIMAQILSYYPSGQQLSIRFVEMIRPLMAPAVWELRGNIPALSGLLCQIIDHGWQQVIETNNLIPILGVFQKLLSMRAYDSYGMDLLDHIIYHIPSDNLAPYLNEVAKILIKKSQNTNAKFYSRLAVTYTFWSAIENGNAGPYFLLKMLQLQDNGLWNLLSPVLDGLLTRNDPYEKNIAVIGLTKVLFEVKELYDGSTPFPWVRCVEIILTLLDSGVVVTEADDTSKVDSQFNIMEFGSSFSKLVMIRIPPLNPAPSVKNAADFFKTKLAEVNSQLGNMLFTNPNYIAGLNSKSKERLATLGVPVN